jgi:hypothetical protein
LHFYVLAVDNLADAVEILRKQYTRVPGVSRAAKHLLKQFHAACPDIHTLRNLIEHFDEYDHLVGDLQQSGVVPKLRMGQVENYSLLPGDAQLSIFGKSMMVSTTTPAARQLGADALALGPLLPG